MAGRGRPGPARTVPCGTPYAYRRHRLNNEPTCRECRAAWAAFQRARYWSKKPTGKE